VFPGRSIISLLGGEVFSKVLLMRPDFEYSTLNEGLKHYTDETNDFSSNESLDAYMD
jgi:hypothetical protein